MTESSYRKMTIDDLFTPSSADGNTVEKKDIQEISTDLLYSFPNHPFRVINDEHMDELCDSIRENGILTPLTVISREEGGYYIVSGHRRRKAAALCGVKILPCVVKDYDIDKATEIMVDSNIQREDVLPSEKAHAYKMRLEAMKRQGKFRPNFWSN